MVVWACIKSFVYGGRNLPVLRYLQGIIYIYLHFCITCTLHCGKLSHFFFRIFITVEVLNGKFAIPFSLRGSLYNIATNR